MIDIKTTIGIIAVILGFIGYLPYLRDVIKGKTRPHVYTWFIWGAVTIILYALQVSGGAGAGAWVTLLAGLLSLFIFFLGLRNGDKNITNSDTIFFVSALIALVLWLVADQPVISVILLVTVGILGFGPTVRKSWNNPNSETLSTYFINAIRHGLSILALAQYSILTWLFPIAWSIANALFALILVIRRRKTK